jgi:hypothetical protein
MQQAQGIPGVPEWYSNWFKAQYGRDYYTTERGGPEQAATDYKTLMQYWGDKTGRLPTPIETTRFLTQFSGHAALLGRPATIEDMLNYATSYLTRPEVPKPLAYLNTGQIA